MSNARFITGLGAPSNAGDAVPKGYVDAKLMRVTGTLQAYTGPAVAFVGVVPFGVVPGGQLYTGTWTVDGTPHAWTVDNREGGDMDAVTVANNILPQIFGGLSTYSYSVDGSGVATVTGLDAGSGQSIAISGGDAFQFSSVTPDAQGSGGTLEVVLVTGVAGQTVKMLGAWFDGFIGSPYVGLYLRDPSNNDTQLTAWDTANHVAAFIPLSGQLMNWINGLTPGESLVAKLASGAIPTDGSTCVVGAVVEQS